MLRHDEDRLHSCHEVHRTADRRDSVGGTGGPVGEVAVAGNLQGAEHAEVEVSAADHREAVRVVEERRTGDDGDLALTGVDQLGVPHSGLR